LLREAFFQLCNRNPNHSVRPIPRTDLTLTRPVSNTGFAFGYLDSGISGFWTNSCPTRQNPFGRISSQRPESRIASWLISPAQPRWLDSKTIQNQNRTEWAVSSSGLGGKNVEERRSPPPPPQATRQFSRNLGTKNDPDSRRRIRDSVSILVSKLKVRSSAQKAVNSRP
jgi:hypothetical protein